MSRSLGLATLAAGLHRGGHGARDQGAEAAHLVCAWGGNSEGVAEDHYLMTTEEDFVRAVEIPAHIPAQSPPDTGRHGQTVETKKAVNPAKYEDHGLLDTPTGSRTPVFGLRTRRPGPLDDGGKKHTDGTRSSSVGSSVKRT